MNSFHQTNHSSTTLDKFIAEKYHWEGTGRQLDCGGGREGGEGERVRRRKEEQTFMVKCLFIYSLHTLIWWRGAFSVSFCKHLLSLELAGLLSASVKWKTCFCVCAELEVFLSRSLSPWQNLKRWTPLHYHWCISAKNDACDAWEVVQKLHQNQEFTTQKRPTEG